MARRLTVSEMNNRIEEWTNGDYSVLEEVEYISRNHINVMARHNKCNHIFKTNMREMKSRYSKNPNFCPHCSRSKFLIEAEEKLKDKIELVSGGEYSLVEVLEYKNTAKNKIIVHNNKTGEDKTTSYYSLKYAYLRDADNSYYDENGPYHQNKKYSASRAHDEEDLKQITQERTNGEYSLEEVIVYNNVHSNKLVFKHNKCGKVFESTFDNVVQAYSKGVCSCPDCRAFTVYTHETLGDYINEQTNGDYKLLDTYKYDGVLSPIELLNTRTGLRQVTNWRDFLTFIKTSPKYALSRNKYSSFSHEEVKEKCKKRSKGEYLITDKYPYQGSHSKIEVFHTTCGQTYETNWANLRCYLGKGLCECKICKPPRKHKAAAVDVIQIDYKTAREKLLEWSKGEYELTDTLPFVNVFEKVSVKHKGCDKEFTAVYNDLLVASFVDICLCPACNPMGNDLNVFTIRDIKFPYPFSNENYKYKDVEINYIRGKMLTHAEACKSVYSATKGEYEMLDDIQYTGNFGPISALHTLCGTRFVTKYTRVRNIGAKCCCPVCKFKLE